MKVKVNKKINLTQQSEHKAVFACKLCGTPVNCSKCGRPYESVNSAAIALLKAGTHRGTHCQMCSSNFIDAVAKEVKRIKEKARSLH